MDRRNYIIFWITNVGEFSLLHLIGVELEEVGDDFGFGRTGRKAVGGQHGANRRRRFDMPGRLSWSRERAIRGAGIAPPSHFVVIVKINLSQDRWSCSIIVAVYATIGNTKTK